ncbi:MAG TPA: A24 family peptidase [Vicinamibacterales bacterium]
MAGTGASSALVDFYTRRIPNPLTLAVAGFGLSIAAAHLTPLSMAQALLGFAVGLVLMLPGHLIGATGAGDVKLFAALGTLLGPRAIAMAFLYTALAGGVLAIVVAMRRQLLRRTFERTADLVRTGGANVTEIERDHVNRFAYAPAIAVGTLAAALGL